MVDVACPNLAGVELPASVAGAGGGMAPASLASVAIDDTDETGQITIARASREVVGKLQDSRQ
jgi:hypothetical protein